MISQVIEEGTAVLTLNHPPVNALSRALLDELETRIQRNEADPAIRAVVIHSALPKFFCAGADIRELAAIPSCEEGRRYSERGQRLMNRIERSSKPHIAAIEGACLGGGLELALACPLRIAAATARLGLPEVNLGLLPGFGGTVRLARVAGPARALEMILTGKDIDATQAAGMGWVHQAVKPGAALETALELARQIQGKSPGSIQAVLTILHHRDAASEQGAFEKEAELFGARFETEDAKEGLRAFLEKRLPRFQGR